MFRLKSECLENCFPKRENFQSLDKILLWTNSHQENVCKCDIPPMRPRAKNPGPKVLLCHDYKYNYLERIVDDPAKYHPLNQDLQFYLFPYWSLIDIFVYFTHDILTVPPPEWTSACHQNGVACFGTFLIEHWASYKTDDHQKLDGKQFLKKILSDSKLINDFANLRLGKSNDHHKLDGKQFLKKILSDIKLIDDFVQAMHNIQKSYKFDGWLINIESMVERDQIERLEYFLKKLKTQTNDTTSSSIQVIWYDSLINTGSLRWQNELNNSNKNFFQNSDAIFLNYTWKDKNLKQSARMLAENRVTNHSRYDIFVGVDCYGRGCHGGGGLQTWLAVQKILEHDLSVAIFAPGWTHELIDSSDCYGLEHEYRFWSPIACKGGLLKCERALSSLPLYTCFNIGRGFDFCLLGRSIPLRKKISGEPPVANRRWLNFEQLELQPSFFEPEQAKNDHHQLSITFNCPFNGGASFQIDIFDGCSSNVITLFKTSIVIDLQQANQFSHQVVYKHQKFGSSNEKNEWIVENLHFRTIIDYEEYHSNDQANSKTGSFILDNSVLKVVLPNEKINESPKSGGKSSIRQFMNHSETFPVNEWRGQRIKIDLDRAADCFKNSKKIILKKFQVQPYFRDEKNDILKEFSQTNPLSVFLGEFYFDYFSQNHSNVRLQHNYPDMFKIVT